jgi:hypothetical protein
MSGFPILLPSRPGPRNCLKFHKAEVSISICGEANCISNSCTHPPSISLDSECHCSLKPHFFPFENSLLIFFDVRVRKMMSRILANFPMNSPFRGYCNEIFDPFYSNQHRVIFFKRLQPYEEKIDRKTRVEKSRDSVPLHDCIFLMVRLTILRLGRLSYGWSIALSKK